MVGQGGDDAGAGAGHGHDDGRGVARIRRTRSGRIAPGFAADIVAIEGNPLENIGDVISGVRWVMKDGVVVVERRRP